MFEGVSTVSTTNAHNNCNHNSNSTCNYYDRIYTTPASWKREARVLRELLSNTISVDERRVLDNTLALLLRTGVSVPLADGNGTSSSDDGT